MKEIKQRKERRFLKTLGRVGEILVEQVLLKLGSSIIKKIGGKKTLPSILFLFLSLSLFAQFPNTGNKQRLGFQTTADGLVYRGSAADTVAIKSSGLNNAYFILDTVNNIQYNYIKTKGGWVFSNGDTIIINNNFTQPVDSLFFNVNVPTNNVDTAKMRWDSDLATVVLGLNDNVPNEIGFKNFWLVKNQTGSTITKGSLVYANGTVGASGRITVAKFIANGSIDAKYLLGITAHDLTDGEDGYVISFGKIRQVNTDTFAAGAILYPSPTVAGVWTDVEPVAPNIDMPIGFCINSSVNNGTIAIRVASGYKLNELHDVGISSPVDKASLYYSGGLWRDTTPTLLVSDTASMLTNYLRTGVAANTYLPLTGGTLTGTINRQEGSHNGSTGAFYYNILNYFARQDNIKYNPTAQISFTDRPGTLTFPNNVRTSDIYLMTARNWNGTSLGQYLDTTLSVVANQDGGRIGISKLNPNYKLDINGTFNASGNSLIGGTLGVTGDLQIGNNLGRSKYQILSLGGNAINEYGWQIARSPQSGGVINDGMYIYNLKNNSVPFVISLTDNIGIGTTNPLSKLEVHGSAAFNEGSTDSDFRVESDGNANMVFVDASTDRVGIGTNAPTRTLEVNGTVGVSSNITANSFIKSGGSFTQFLKADGTVDGNDYLTTSSAGSTYYPKTGGTISGAVTLSTTTATPTSLLGKDGSNVVGNVRLTPPLSLAGDSLNLGTVPITKGGTGAESASVARTTLGVGYVFLSTTTGGTVLLSSNRAYLVITGTGSTTTIDLSTATSGRQYMIKNLSNASVVSDASNIIPLDGGAAGTAILSAGNVTPQWVTLVADGTNWHVMQRN